MRFPSLIRARFLQRDNRFRVTTELDGEQVWAHLANPGRARELLRPGASLFLVERPEGHRKTRYDVALVEAQGQLISADARLPNALFAEALALGNLGAFAGFAVMQREVRRGDSRLDFVVQREGDILSRCWVEVKSVTLVEKGVGLFPDAPTLRGRRHLLELADLAQHGERAAVVFVIQRPDVRSLRPNDVTDPAFGDTLRLAARSGVDIYAHRCLVDLEGICIDGEVPVDLSG